MTKRVPRDTSRGVYSISIAAELAGLGVQTLRLYETRGLLEPDRSAGETRRYSDDDVTLLQHIGELVDSGLNIAGVAAVLQLEETNRQLRGQLASAEQNLQQKSESQNQSSTTEKHS
jgi:MerR family transcriptional regulator/heat shock protein HspR